MSDETLPPVKRSDGSLPPRGTKAGPPIDPTSVTLSDFAPVATTSTVAASLDPTNPAPSPPLAPSAPHAGGPADQTLVATPPAPDTTIAASPDVTLAPRSDGVTLIAPAFDVTLGAASHTGGPADATLAGLPSDATLGSGGLDAATRAFHQAAMASAPKAITKGASFGHYELIEPIAKGGMGIVYKARQRSLNRIVALKMILAGQFADQEDINRFYAEAEAAAALSHPNIVAIHEIGEVSGQHFFSMDYIEGQSLSGLIHENPVPPRRAAEFIITIAETMQFAHDSGVVHRDLKPANVLLDKRQRPLITDFGLAKQVSNTSQLTMAGSIVGTPSYMPPEQAAGKIEEVGTWSDLYSIGAILYELLTGRPPFRAASPFETIRQVLETEAPSPRLLNPSVPRDLETICLKCLQKARTNRYASAQELADELKRFLNGEPIHARPISQAARFWRLCQRHPITSSAIALAALFFVGASISITVAYFRTSAALSRETVALKKSDESLSEAIAAVNDFFTTVSEDELINEPGMQSLREKLLTKTKTYFERFSEQRAGDPKVEVELAGAYYRLGEIAAMLQAPDDAIKPYEKAREIQERVVALRPKDLPGLKALGDTVNAIGKVRNGQRDFEAARTEFDTAVKIRTQLVSGDPAKTENQRVLANTHMNIGLIAQFNGDYPRARQEFETSQKIREAALPNPAPQDVQSRLQRDFAMGLFNLGNLDLMEGAAGAEEHFKESADAFEKLTVLNSKSQEYQKQLALSYRRLASVLASKNKLDEARDYYQKALDRAAPLAQQNPKVVDYSIEWAGVLMEMFHFESKAGNPEKGTAHLERSRDILFPLVKEFPTVARCQRDLAVALYELGSRKFDEGNGKSAREILEQALTIDRQLVEHYSQEPFILMEATTLRKLADIDAGEGQGSAALKHLVAATTVMRQLAKDYPGDQNQFDLALTLRELAEQQHACGDDKSAAKHRDEAIQLLTELVKQFPDDSEFAEELKTTQAVTRSGTTAPN